MKCPICNVDLKMAERHEVEIDYCPQCRGVWLDRGELDKIIDKATGPTVAAEPVPPRAPEPPRRDWEAYRSDDRDRGYAERPRDSRHRDDRYRDEDRYYKKGRRKSILSEIFDFD